MGRYAPLLVRVSAVKVHFDHLDTAFFAARPLVYEVMDEDALFVANAWGSAWKDLFHCWCGCPL